jgi:hypothetical protein
MSSRKTQTSSKHSDIVDRRISQLFKDLREASGIVRGSNNNEEQIPGKEPGHIDSLEKKLSLAFSDVFSDPSSIPPFEPASVQKPISVDGNVLNLIRGFIVQDENLEPVLSLDEDIKQRFSSSSHILLSTSIGTNPETMLVQIPIIDPTTNDRMFIICEIERTKTDKTWDESDMVRMKNILVHLDILLKQRQNQD